MYARIALIAACSLSASFGQAQTREPMGFSIERFHPAIDGSGILDAESGTVAEHMRWSASFWLNYANDPLVLNAEEGDSSERVAALVGDRLGATLVGSIGLYERYQIGAELPIALYQGRDSGVADVTAEPKSLSVGGLGDLRLAPKVQILDADRFFVDLAVISNLTLPTSTSRAYLGEKTVTWVPEVAASKRLGRLRVAGNLGFRVRSRVQVINMVVNDELTYRVAAAYDIEPYVDRPIEVAAVLSGQTPTVTPFRKVPRNPMELMLGGQYDIMPGVAVLAGLGVGVVAGHGTPDFRLFSGVRMEPVEPAPPREKLPLDRDEDGFADPVDSCPLKPEDVDQFEDNDGCPDPDNDGDGVLDVADGAPNDPEDVDGFEDEDGVPDPDNDADGIADGDDKCPMEAETANGWEDEDGCPEDIPDSDGDGVADNIDKCVDVAEDRDEFEDVDGCPDEDNDQDEVLDINDQCPLQPGPADNSGCPDQDRDGDSVADRFDNCPDEPGPPELNGCKTKQLVQLTAEKIEIKEKVYFDTNSDVIKEVSFELLDQVAKVLMAHPEIEKIRVEGHTDSVGPAAYNLDLSERRAASVKRFLVGKGVAETRLESQGLGEDRPIASNSSASGQATNRRVEFLIVKAEGDTEPGAGQ